MRLVPVALLCLLSACAVNRETFIRTDGQDIQRSAVLQQQREIDLAVCRGEAERASLSAGAQFAGIHEEIQRVKSSVEVGKGCMATRGYLSAPVEQAEVMRRQFEEAHRNRSQVAGSH